MSEAKVPKVVLFSAFGRVVPALVLAARYGEPSHLGGDGEPTLSLALVDPARESNLAKDLKTGEYIYPPGRLPQVFTEHDVVHESHEFSDQFKKDKGVRSAADELSHRGHGEWTEYTGDDNSTVFSAPSALASGTVSSSTTVAGSASYTGGTRSVVTRLQALVSRVSAERDEAAIEAAKQRARADQAEAERDELKKKLEAPAV